jgi:hypothetical protein
MPQQTGAGDRGPAIATAVAVLAVVVATATAVWMVDRQERQEAEDELRSTLREMVLTLDLWTADQVRGVKAVAAEPRVREAVAALVAGRPAEVESWVRVSSAIRGYTGYVITDSEGRVVASDRPEVVGRPALFASDQVFTARLRAEGAAITRPVPSLVPFPDAKGVVRIGSPTQFVCAWVAPAGSLGGALCFRVDPLSTFSVVLSGGQVGATGEAYAIDREGRLMSPSRFEADLVETGIVSADFRHNFLEHLHKQAFLFVLIKIKDSGSYLIKSHSYSPFKFLNPPGCGTSTTANRFWSGDI